MIDLFLNIISDFLSFFKQILKDELSTSVFENGVGDFGDGKTEILNSVIGVSRVDDSVINSRIDIDGNVVFGDDILIEGRDT